MKKIFDILVSTQTTYLLNQSDPDKHRFTWAYEVTIKNNLSVMVQLLNRYWKITDMTGTVNAVEGPGVVGLQPLIKAGATFVYNSFCQLTTPQGSMEGYYEMQNLEEERFIVEIPKFILTAPVPWVQEFRSMLH